MAKKTHAPHRSEGSRRPTWSGMFSFGLVSFPIEAVNALNRQRSDIHFHLVHKECHSRIRYQKVCPVHGEVTKEEIVSAYEYKKNKYVEIDPEELRALRSESDRALKVEAFVGHDVIDPLFFDGRMYYLMPSGHAAEEAYGVVAEAMEKEKRYAIAHIIFSGKDQIALVRPREGVLQMAMLNYQAEIRPANELAQHGKSTKGNARQVKLAQTLIQEWSQDEFDFSKFEDLYRDKVKKLIESKVEGHELVTPAETKPRPVLNLMDALRRSVHANPRRARHGRRSA